MSQTLQICNAYGGASCTELSAIPKSSPVKSTDIFGQVPTKLSVESLERSQSSSGLTKRLHTLHRLREQTNARRHAGYLENLSRQQSLLRRLLSKLLNGNRGAAGPISASALVGISQKDCLRGLRFWRKPNHYRVQGNHECTPQFSSTARLNRSIALPDESGPGATS